jgi:hypothetical protein
MRSRRWAQDAKKMTAQDILKMKPMKEDEADEK